LSLLVLPPALDAPGVALAVTADEDKLAFVAGEQRTWHDLSVSTDHDDVSAT
jgi:hypothetical protein